MQIVLKTMWGSLWHVNRGVKTDKPTLLPGTEYSSQRPFQLGEREVNATYILSIVSLPRIAQDWAKNTGHWRGGGGGANSEGSPSNVLVPNHLGKNLSWSSKVQQAPTTTKAGIMNKDRLSKQPHGQFCWPQHGFSQSNDDDDGDDDEPPELISYDRPPHSWEVTLFLCIYNLSRAL